MYHMKSRREPYINIENKSKTPSPWMHGGGVFYIMGESVGISYYINSPAGQDFFLYKTIIKFCKNFWRTNLKSFDKKGRIIMSGDTMTMKRTKFNIRTIAVTGMLGALATVLMFLEFPIPMLIPPFIKFDFSELPALLAAYAMGPVSGIAVCFIKNAINLLHTQTGGVGELSNFILGVCFVLPAGLIYKKKKTQKSAMIGALAGAVLMSVVSVFSNYFVVYPVYTNFMPMQAILGAYQAINKNVKTLWDALIWFNMPFTFIKGMCSVVITFFIYKKISPILKGTNR